MAITKIGQYVFYYHPNLETVRVSATTIEQSAFATAPKLKTVDLTSTAAVDIAKNAFSNCKKLTHLVIRSNTVSTLSGTNHFYLTNIAMGRGGIYVPSNLVSSYKSASNWSSYADSIYPIDDYPRTHFETISDSWATIFANPSYATDYSIGSTKCIDLTDGTVIQMELVGLDIDEKSDNSGTAKMSWVSKAYYYTHDMNSTQTTSGGWASSGMRNWLINDILPKIQQEVRSHIVSVKKTYRSKSPNDETLVSDDEIWIPSYKEINYTTNLNSSYIESSGVVYTNFNAQRRNTDTNENENYWLRTAATSTAFVDAIRTLGISYNNPIIKYGVIFGFCTD